MQAKSAKQLLTRFLEFTESEALGAFAALARAQRPKHSEYIYIPGEREDRILLVAHADTVNDSKYSPKLHWMGDVCTLETYWRKPSKKVYDADAHAADGIAYNHHSSLGADDRAGCAMLWALQNMGHSLLITTGEEGGCKGARVAARELKDELGKHAYALEIDRRGDRQAVFYDISTAAFEGYMLGLLTKSDPDAVEWTQEVGSFTDVRAICPEAHICGVNLSAGYFREHSEDEHLYLEAWLHTHATLLKALKEKQRTFMLPKKIVASVRRQSGAHWKWCLLHGCWSDKCPDSANNYCERVKEEAAWSTGNPTTGVSKGGSITESPFRLQVFRTGGTKSGEGQVELRAFGAGGKAGLLSRISKRQCKKFGKYLQRLSRKGAINNVEATTLLAQAIELRDGLQPLVTQEQRDAHAAGSTDAFVKPAKGNGHHGGEFVLLAGFEHSGRCWHFCRGCRTPWYHVRQSEAEDRPTFFCYCPTCSPNVVPRLIAPDGIAWVQAAWSHESTICPAPQAVVELGRTMPSVHSVPSQSQSLNQPTSCQHYCARCGAPWRHYRQSITRGGGLICGVGAYDGDCPLHSAKTAKVVFQYEEQLHLKGGWRNTMHAPPEEMPATGNDPHGAAPLHMPSGGSGTGQSETSGGGGVLH